jgi:hypothetical protein
MLYDALSDLLPSLLTWGAAAYAMLDAGITWLASTWVGRMIFAGIAIHLVKSLVKEAVEEVLDAREAKEKVSHESGVHRVA